MPNSKRVRHVKDPQMQGWLGQSHFLAIINKESGEINHTPVVEVFWDKQRTPCPAFHKPDEIQWMSYPGYTDETGINTAHDEEDYEDEEEYSEELEGVEV